MALLSRLVFIFCLRLISIYNWLWALIFLSTSSFANNAPVFKNTNQFVSNLNHEQGLSQASSTAIAQDDLGYIWVGTQGGLNRYDGHRFTTFRSEQVGLAGNFIAALCNGENNKLWIGTRTGLSVYDYKLGRFRSYFKESFTGIPSDMVQSLSCDKDKIYVGTYDNGLYILELASDTVSSYLALENTRVNDIAHHRKQTYVATDSGVFLLHQSGGGVTQLTTHPAKSVLFDKHAQRLIVGQNNGWVKAYSYRNKVLNQHWNIKVGHISNRALDHIVIHNSQYLIATNNGMYTLNAGGNIIDQLRHNTNDKNSLRNNIITRILVDSENNIWLGSESEGISYFNQRSKQFGHINSSTNSPLESHDIRHMALDDKQRFWIATSIGVYVYENYKFVKAESLYSALIPLKNAYVTNLLFDNETLWLTTAGEGIISLSLVHNSVSSYNNNTRGITAIYNSIVKYQGDIIAGSRGNGVFRYDRKLDRFVTFIDPHVSKLKVPYHLLVVDETLWISSMGNGLFRYRDNKLKRLSVKNGSPTNIFYALSNDDRGRVWAATERGVIVIDDELNIKKIIDEGTGLADNATWSLLFDQYNSVWAGTSSGLSKIDVNDLSVRNYLPYDGVQGLEYNGLAFMLTPDRRVFIGGSNGFNHFNPLQIKTNTPPPQIVLSDIMLLGNSISPTRNPELLSATVEYLTSLSLAHDQDILTLKYSALDHTKQRIDYFFRVQGLSNDWLQMPDSLRQFNLMRLPPNKYTIEAYAKNTHGQKSSIHRLTIEIDPPWWWSPLSKLCYCVFTLSLLYFFYYLKRNAYTRLEQLVSQRTTQLSQKNGTLQETLEQLKRTQSSLIESEKMAALGGLVAGVAHEINTPLSVAKTGLSYNRDEMIQLQRMIEDNKLTKDKLIVSITNQHQGYQLSLDNLERAIHLITTFKKVTVDQSCEEQREINLKQFFSEIILTLKPILNSHRIGLSLTGSDDIEIITYPGPLYQIVNNFINNSIKHAFEGRDNRKIAISVKQDKNQVIWVYKDNGLGIPENILPLIYQPFVTSKRHDGGSGLGMHIVYNLVTQLFKGSINCESTPEEGCVFSIKFPVEATKNHSTL